MTVPSDPALPCLLSAGVDVQENRLVVVVRAWGKGEENFLTYYTELYGDPNQADVWKQLTHLASRPFVHETGAALHIVSMAIDTGYLTQTVYNFCRTNPRYMAIKGAKSPASPIISKPRKVDVTWSGQTIKSGVDLWSIGTDSAKVQIYSRLAMKKRGPGYYHFYAGLDDEYYLQLTAEKRLTQYRDGFPVLSWVKLRERNDVLDCEVYAYAAALRAGLVHLNFDEIYLNLLSGPGAQGEPERPQATNQKPKRKRW
jgi:phage terminase large subunit GpA-like protein